MADKFPNTEVLGIDIAAVQPAFVPPGVIFEIEDAEEDWLWPSDHFDFVHGRDLLTAIRDWPRLISQAFRVMRPGGWIQLASTIPDVQSDDNTLPPNCAFKEVGDTFLEMGEKMGAPVTAPRRWSTQLERAGFINVEDVVLKIPSNPWPKDKRLRSVGAIERAMLVDGLEAYMLRGWTQNMGRKVEDCHMLCALAKRELSSTSMHAYVDFHITYGQKPS
jgi:SAM-dependent methyltransferase